MTVLENGGLIGRDPVNIAVRFDYCATKRQSRWPDVKSQLTMKCTRTCLIATFVLAVAGLGAAIALPPWDNIISAHVHLWLSKGFGLEIHKLDHYTGVVRFWDSKGRLRGEYRVADGVRDGPWIEYDESGAIASRAIYRQGDPWDGICYLFDGKAWQGEYRAGKPWNGCLPVRNELTGRSEWKCFIDGVPVSDEAYRVQKGLDSHVTLIGLHYVAQ